MRRVLVPLDGTALGEAILHDARMLAGDDGELILVRDASRRMFDPDLGLWTESYAVGQAEGYLYKVAESLADAGQKVEAHALVLGDVSFAIDEAARIFKADMIACATHGRSPLGRLFRGGVAWRAIAHSEIPVLLRHVEVAPVQEPLFAPRPRIMVPLDGSRYAEAALPLAHRLADEWSGALWLSRVIVPDSMSHALASTYGGGFQILEQVVAEAEGYLECQEETLGTKVQTTILCGDVAGELERAVLENDITHVVMSSHGRNGLARVILGSVADALVERLHVPVLVIPSMAVESMARVRSDEARVPVELS